MIKATYVKPCDCGCSHVTDKGACGDFYEGRNGRCVYCDHAEKCHTEEDPDTHNTPLGIEN